MGTLYRPSAHVSENKHVSYIPGNQVYVNDWTKDNRRKQVINKIQPLKGGLIFHLSLQWRFVKSECSERTQNISYES